MPDAVPMRAARLQMKLFFMVVLHILICILAIMPVIMPLVAYNTLTLLYFCAFVMPRIINGSAQGNHW